MIPSTILRVHAVDCDEVNIISVFEFKGSKCGGQRLAALTPIRIKFYYGGLVITESHLHTREVHRGMINR